MRTIYVGERISHHAKHSGYDQLTKFVHSRTLNDRNQQYLAKVLNLLPSSWPGRWLDQPPYSWYWKNSQLASEVLAMASMPFSKAVYHWLYGENDFRWAGSTPRGKNSRVVVSLHQPPEVFSQVYPCPNRLKKTDTIIACSSQQKDFLTGIAGQEKVHFIPHGVDTDFFSPGKKQEDEKKSLHVLYIGSWLRDMPCLEAVIGESNRLGMPFRFNLVLPRKEGEPFLRYPEVRLHCQISDPELLNLYRSSQVLLMPLENCSASNSILEAMACGLPLVIADVGGVRDYLDESCALFFPKGDAQRALEALGALAEDNTLRRNMAQASRQRAMNYDWRLVAASLREVYEKLYA